MSGQTICNNLHEVGVYYTGPIGAILEEYQEDFRLNYGLESDDFESHVSAELSNFDFSSEYYHEVAYDYTDYDEFESLKETIFEERYPYYLLYSPSVNWRGASGYRFITRPEDLLSYSEEFHLDYNAYSDHHEVLSFRYSSHDIPMGATHYYIGLSEETYETLVDQTFDEIEAFASNKIETAHWHYEW